MTLIPDLDTKRSALERILREMGSVVVAYSGGVDSAFLAVAAQMGGEQMCKLVHERAQGDDAYASAPFFVNLGAHIEDRLVLRIDLWNSDREVIPPLDEVGHGQVFRMDSAKQSGGA